MLASWDAMSLFEIFNTAYFGNTITQYTMYFIVLSIAIILAKMSYLFFKNIVSQWVRKTKIEFDDVFVDILEEPLSFLIIIAGIAYGRSILTLSEHGLTVYNGLLKALIIINAAWFVVRFLDSLVVHYLTPFVKHAKKDIDDAVIRLIRRLLKFFGAALTVIILLDNLGYDVTTLIAGLGIGGLALALAAQDVLSNLFGGVTVVTDKPFKAGDRIKFDTFDGFVEDVGLRSTKVRTLDGSQLVVPNAVLTKSVVENVTRENSRKVVQTLRVTYDTPLEKINKSIQVIKEVVRKNKSTDENALVSFNNFGDSALEIMVIYWIKDTTLFLETKHEINSEIKKTFEKLGIEFAYPTRTLHFADSKVKKKRKK